MPKQPLVILMAEDNEHDIVATRRVWRTHHLTNPLYIVTDGEACLDYLYQCGQYSVPSDGLRVLNHLREDARFHRLPVVIFTTSRLAEDRICSYELGATTYISKPIDFHNFAETLRSIILFWGLVELPE